MRKKFILSASGIQNILINHDDDITFIFGQHQIKINRFFAEFISPLASNILKTDPTTSMIYFNTKQTQNDIYDNEKITNLLELVTKISQGKEVEIDETTSNELRIISILLGNEEMFMKMEELFPLQDEAKLDFYIQYLEIIDQNKKSSFFKELFYGESLIKYISKNFYKIEHRKLHKLSYSIVYSVISSEALKLTNEDSLLEFIDDYYYHHQNENEKEHEGKYLFDRYHLYEKVEFTTLSEKKLNDFVNKITSSEMSEELWNKLRKCIYTNKEIVSVIEGENKRMSRHSERYTTIHNKGKIQNVSYEAENDKFKGIIWKLSEGKPMTLYDKGIIDIKSSPSCSSSEIYQNKNVFDFVNDQKIFNSKDDPNSWFCYDFKERKVKLSHYSIRSHSYPQKKNNRLQTWKIEGSNDFNEWKILDTRSNEDSICDIGASNTFQIDENKPENDFYRYIKITQTGVNNSGNNQLVFSVMEFYGSILEQ